MLSLISWDESFITNTIYLGGPEALEMMEIVSGVNESLENQRSVVAIALVTE